MKHFITAANHGCGDLLEGLRKGYVAGKVRKEEFAAAPRAHRAAVVTTKSLQREAAAAKSDDEAAAEFILRYLM